MRRRSIRPRYPCGLSRTEAQSAASLIASPLASRRELTTPQAAPPKRPRKRKTDTDVASLAPRHSKIDHRYTSADTFWYKEVALSLAPAMCRLDGTPRLELIFLYRRAGVAIKMAASQLIEISLTPP